MKEDDDGGSGGELAYRVRNDGGGNARVASQRRRRCPAQQARCPDTGVCSTGGEPQRRASRAAAVRCVREEAPSAAKRSRASAAHWKPLPNRQRMKMKLSDCDDRH